MTITEEKIDNLRSKVKVNLKKEDYEPTVKKQINTLAKKVEIKGFRPGMVPVGMVKKMYGNSVLFEEIEKMLGSLMQKYIDENKINVLVSPIPSAGQTLDLDISRLADIDFSYDVSHSPDINLTYIEQSPVFTKYKIRADDKLIDEEVMRIRQRFSTYEYPETVGEKDVLTVMIEELDAEGNLKPGGVETVSTLTVDLLKEDAQKKILPLKKQESIEYNVFELMDRDRESIAKNVLNMNDLAKLGEVGDRFRLTLNNITRSVPGEVNEEFFVKVYGPEGPKTEEEMRNNIKGDLESYFEGSADKVLVNELYKGLMENVELPLPEDYLKRWLEVHGDKPMNEQELNDYYPKFEKSLRWSLIERKIANEQNIQITDEEVNERVRRNLIHQLYGYGLKTIGEEWIAQFVQKQLADKKVVSETRDQLLDEKVLDFIKTKVKQDEKEVSFEEFNELMKAPAAPPAS